MTKKILALALALALVFSFAACGSKDKGSSDSGDSGDKGTSIVGEWTLAGAEVAGQEIGKDQLGTYNYSWTFEDGGKASINVMGQKAETTYTFENNTVKFADQTAAAITLKLDGKKLVWEEETSKTKFFFEKK